MDVKEPSAKYLVRRGYKQTEVGVIPETWDARPLKDVCLKITDGDHATPKRTSSGYYLLSARNVLDGRIDVSDVDYVGVDEFRRMKRRCGPEESDVLISCSGTIGRVAVVPSGFECVLVRSAALAKPDREQADGVFLQYALQSTKLQSQIAASVNQGAQPNLFLNHIERLVCPTPPIPEQHAIAEALSDADALIESLEQLLAMKRLIKQGAMQELLTGKKRLHGFGGEWATKLLGDLFTFSGGFTASREQLSSNGYCYLHYGDIHTAKKIFVDVSAEYQDIPKLDVSLKKVSAASLLEDGDVVFVDASEDDDGTSKHVVIANPGGVPFISGLHTIVAKSRNDLLVKQYRRYCFQTEAIKAQFKFFAVGTKVSGVSKSNIAKITLPIPAVQEQEAIASILSDMDADLAALEARLAKARCIKQGMMRALLTGRIRLV